MDRASSSKAYKPPSGNGDNHHYQKTPSANKGSRQYKNRAVNTTQPRESSFLKPSAQPERHYSTAAFTNRTVHGPVFCFQTLLDQLSSGDLESTAHHFKGKYEGRKHSKFATQLKRFTLQRKHNLYPAERDQLLPLMTSWGKSCNFWSLRSLATALHALTSAGVFALSPHTEISNHQAKLMKVLLNAVTGKCNQRPIPQDIYAQGITNLLWAVAKLVDNGMEQTQVFKEAVAALLPHVNTWKDHFNPQAIANLLWAVAKLVDNGLEQTPELKETVAALLPQVITQKANFNPQAIANLLWAVAKLVDNGLEQTQVLKETVATLLPQVITRKANFNPQHIANLLWAVAKLVDNGLEQTQVLKETVATLLPQVITRKANFNPQHIANLLWAVAKLVDNGLEQTQVLKETVATLLPQVITRKANFNPQHIANLLWAMAKLVDNGLEQTQALKEAVAALLPHVITRKDHFNPQGIANLLWAVAKLVDNGLEQTQALKEAVVALLPHVNTLKDNFNPQAIANLLWALAKLADNGLEQTQAIKEAVAALLPHVNTRKDNFKPQEIANLLWAVAKLVDNGLEQTQALKEAMAALLPHVNIQKDHYNAQEIANLLWAVAKLVDNGLEQTQAHKEAVAALLPHVNTQKANFKPQEISNLLWAIATMGEFIEKPAFFITDLVKDQVLNELTNSSQLDMIIALWGLLAVGARQSPGSHGASVVEPLEQPMRALFDELKKRMLCDQKDLSIMAMAASWLNLTCQAIPSYDSTISHKQSQLYTQLKWSFPSEEIQQEVSINHLPPVDIMFPKRRLVIEVQGPQHYIGGDYKTRNGNTILKIALYQNLGYRVIDVPVNKLKQKNGHDELIRQLNYTFNVRADFNHVISLEHDEIYLTANEGSSSDDDYATADEAEFEQ